MATTAPAPSRASAEDGIPSLVGRAAVWTGLLGLALGISCRSFSEGSAGLVGIGLSQLGAPWVVVAFAAGVLVAGERSADPAVERAGVALGGLAGAGTMVVASFSYYGDASSPSAVFWAAAGLVVGGAAGLAGAAWRARPGGVVEATAAGALGLALAAEGIGRLDFGWFHSTGQVSHLGARWLVAAGLALPVLLTRGRPAGVVASIFGRPAGRPRRRPRRRGLPRHRPRLILRTAHPWSRLCPCSPAPTDGSQRDGVPPGPLSRRRPARPRRSAVLSALVVVGGVVLGALGYQSLGHSSPAWPPSPIAGVPPGPAPPLGRQGDSSDVLGLADGAVPDGVTVFDDEVPAVANLDAAFLAALRRAASDAGGDGVQLHVNSGWRSRAYQEQLLREAVSEYGSEEEAARWVSTPDTSLHVSGDAIDIGGAGATPGCPTTAPATGCARSTTTSPGTSSCAPTPSTTAARPVRRPHGGPQDAAMS